MNDADLLEVLTNMLSDVRAVAASAMAANRASLALQATGSAREIVKAIHDIAGTGDDPSEVIAAIREGALLVQGVAATIRQRPEFGALLADALESDDSEMAEQIRGLSTRAQKSLDMKEK